MTTHTYTPVRILLTYGSSLDPRRDSQEPMGLVGALQLVSELTLARLHGRVRVSDAYMRHMWMLALARTDGCQEGTFLLG